MDENNIDYITEEKRKALKEELKELQTTRRKEILESLEFAKSLGDLSENAEYHQAREEQGKLEERISKIEHILKESVVVSKHHSTKAEVGATVVVKKEGEKESKRYQIVGSEEASMAEGKISNRSPLGQALFGKKKGDRVSFETPNGTIEYTIIEIE
jgi:transcription elongation factor GreA